VRRFSSFRRRIVETTSGKRLGRCHDLRGEVVSGRLRITGLCVGRAGWLAHFGVQGRHRNHVVPWEAVVRIEGTRIVVRDDADT
jgi:sporulation protein YlmC with PRC-barrel domain